MHDSEYGRFVDELKLLAERLPKNLTPRLTEAYFNTLKKYHMATVSFVMQHWPKNPAHKKFPLEGELLAIVKANSTQVYEETVKSLSANDKKIEELEKRFTLISKQICANGIDTKLLMNNPAMKRLMAVNGKAAQEISRDYSAHKSCYTTQELYQQQNAIRKEISDLVRVI